MEQFHLKVILRWVWLLAIFPIVAGLAAYVYVKQQPTVYQAETVMLVGPGLDSPNPNLDALKTGAQLMQTYVELPRTDAFLEALLTKLDFEISKAQITKSLEIRPIVDTQILKIVVQNKNPDHAVAIANATADELVALSPSTEDTEFLLERMRNQAQKIELDIINTEERINELSSQLEIETDATKRNLLVQQIADEEKRLSTANNTLAALYQMLQTPNPNKVEIIGRAEEAKALSSQLALYGMVAVVGGVVISAILAILIIFFESGLVNVETLPHTVETPLWGTIKPHTSKKRFSPIEAASSASVSGQYRKLGTQLLYRHESENLHTVLLASTETRNCVPEVAAALAVTVANTGKTVLLIDANLYTNTIGAMFGLDADSGLANALAEKNTEIEPVQHSEISTLYILPSGQAVQNPFSLIASPTMLEVLKKVRHQADIVLIAAPPLFSYEDGLALASHVDGIVPVVTQRRTRISKLEKTVENLKAVGANVAGIVIAQISRF